MCSMSPQMLGLNLCCMGYAWNYLVFIRSFPRVWRWDWVSVVECVVLMEAAGSMVGGGLIVGWSTRTLAALN